MHLPHYVRATLILSAMAMCGQSLAVSCDDASPQLELGDVYYDIPLTKPLSHTQQKDYARLVQRLVGKWNGDRERLYCKGGIGNMRMERRDDSSEVTVERRGEIQLRIRQDYRSKNNTYRHELFDLFEPKISQELIELDSHHIKVRQKYRQVIDLNRQTNATTGGKTQPLINADRPCMKQPTDSDSTPEDGSVSDSTTDKADKDDKAEPSEQAVAVCSVMHEVVLALTVDSYSLHIESTRYLNGTFAVYIASRLQR